MKKGINMKVAVLGTTGMLGNMVTPVFEKAGVDIVKLSRSSDGQKFDATDKNVYGLLRHDLRGCDWAINCIGTIKPNINANDIDSVHNALKVNAMFPHHLAKAAEDTGTQVIQIATDCVYTGSVGNYIEDSLHNATDVYGKTKSLGEVRSRNMHHLRCSIIGPEPNHPSSLFEWFIKSEDTINGYTNHLWNGITTVQFAKICLGIINNNVSLDYMQHIYPLDTASKYELLKIFRYVTNKDINIIPTQATYECDRTLYSRTPEFNEQLWKFAGYTQLPTIEQMVREMVEYKL
jgi:dTDP-4-dehydrorhamnose reductase